MSAPTEFTFEKGYKLDYYDQVLEVIIINGFLTSAMVAFVAIFQLQL